MKDSDNAPGTGGLFANSSGGANDIILSIGVEDSTGESTVYAEIDGVSETIDLLKPVAIAAAGVKLTGANGSLTILGLGDGQDEDLKIDLNTTADTIEITSPASSAAAIDINTLNLVSTDYIAGGVKLLGTWASPITSVGAYALAAANAYNTLVFYNDTDEITLPAAVAGMNVCIMVPAATLVPIGPDGTDVIVLEGTALAAGGAFSVAAVAGNFACLAADAANHWVTMGTKGIMTAL